MGQDPKCKNACKKCPDVVVLGAESRLLVELNGIAATEYVRALPNGVPGRALQAEPGDGISMVQYASTIFQGA
jgi:hypothetical protein